MKKNKYMRPEVQIVDFGTDCVMSSPIVASGTLKAPEEYDYDDLSYVTGHDSIVHKS